MSFFRKLFGGDRKLSDTMSWNNSDVKAQLAAGTANTDEGLAGLRSLSGDYRDYIAAGGLTPALNRQFDVQRGALSDQYARSGRSLSAALAARRAQSGGALTPAAIAEMESEGATKANEDYFTASNDLSGQQAELSYSATKDWYGKLQEIQDTITQTGLTREQQAMLARLQLAAFQLQRRGQAISGLTGIFGGVGTKAVGG